MPIGFNTSGSEYRVNTFTSNNQFHPAIATTADGGYLIVWESRDQDGDGYGIYAQKYDRSGSPDGSEFRINTTTEESQLAVSVAQLADGGFLVAWSSSGDLDGDSYGNFAQRLDANLNPVGAEFQINDFTTGIQYATSVGALSNGGFVVAWSSSGQDGSANGVFAKQFAADGSLIGTTEFQVNTTTFTNQSMADVKGLTDGGYLIVWQSDLQDGDNGHGVFAQRFTADGTKTGNEFQVNTHFLNNQNRAEIAVLKDGGFVITWESRDQDGSDRGVYAQRYDKNGNTVGTEFQVSTHTDDDQYEPAIAAMPDGGFIIVWTSEDDQDGSSRGVFGQRFDAAGEPVSGEIQINTHTGNHQDSPVITVLEDSSFVISWSSNLQDGSSRGVYAQNFDGHMVGTAGRDDLKASRLDDKLFGLGGRDKLKGQNGDDALFGGRGLDHLFGQNGDDVLYGGRGSDILNGGRGADMLYGGRHPDQFVFVRQTDSLTGSKADTIADFEIGKDVIVMAMAETFDFIGGDAFSGTGSEVRVADTGDGGSTVYADLDGDGQADMQINILGVTGLAEDSFIL